ncbi:Protein ALP1-like [Holothuria leucospilota]|uniref:Putative nuclease HARBI1 n=1 Tax=Holothuria leucospilota TaxID=206669 RepID=A0A9Q1CL63_HOLLE|nr:Protein ALP1-like [Holothuria leucospilota]
MAALLRIQERNRIRRERIFRDRLDPLAVPEEDLIRKYRLPRAEIINLVELSGEDLERATNRSHSVPVAVQVATSLRFFASGTFQNVLGDSCGLSQPTMSRIINSFTESLVRRVNEFVYLPAGREKRKTIAEFAAVSNFPNVLGVIDGTHVPIKSPSENVHLYIKSKNFHSINVQLVCDKNYFVMDVVLKWPGSTHESFILRNSSLTQIFENGIITDGWLLGDSGYPSKPWLLTPLRNPVSLEELRYNNSHRTTTCVVERCIGVLKSASDVYIHLVVDCSMIK